MSIVLEFNNDNKLTEGTEATIKVENGSIIESATVELIVDDITAHQEVITTKGSNNKTVGIDDFSNLIDLKDLMFYEEYNTRVKVTTESGENAISLPVTIKNYTVGNSQSLKAVATIVNGGEKLQGETVYQIADIDLSTVCSSALGSWVPIGATGTIFSGTFNGNYHKIKNLYYDSNAYANVGLFSGLSGTVEATLMENINISNTFASSTVHSFTGGITGVLNTSGKILRCGNLSGSVSITNMTALNSSWRSVEAGGMAGTSSGSIQSCFNMANITANAYKSSGYVGGYAGGIAAFQSNCSEIKDCYNSGQINGNGGHCYVGGIFGASVWSTVQSTLKNSYNCGSVSGSSYNYTRIGGIIGENGWNGSDSKPWTVTNSYTINTTSYSYWYYNGSSMTTSKEGWVDSANLKGYAGTLGSNNWVTDENNINNYYPILRWQVENN